MIQPQLPRPQFVSQTITPVENLVVGITTRLLLIEHITIELDGAVSAYIRDVWSTLVSAEGSNPVVRFFGRLFTSRLATQATQAAVGYQVQNAGIKFQYKRIDPRINGYDIIHIARFAVDTINSSLAKRLLQTNQYSAA